MFSLVSKLVKDYRDNNIILLFDSCYSTNRMYSDIRIGCYRVLRVNNINDLDMLKITPNDVIITDLNTYKQAKMLYNINYFVIQNNQDELLDPRDYNVYGYNSIKLQHIKSQKNKPLNVVENFVSTYVDELTDNDIIIANPDSSTEVGENVTKSVYIVIPTYNQEKYTVKCFNSINKYYDDDYDINIVWVDNGSTADSLNLVNKSLTKLNNLKNKIHKINFDEPIGYVKSTNSGIEYALSQNADYIVLQNNDTIVTKDWLKPLIKSLDNEGVVGAGPITNSPLARQGFEKIKINVLRDLPDLTNKTTDEITDILHDVYKDYNVIFNDEVTVDVTLAFYCTVFKSSIFKEIGMLDESFGLGYGDDVDFCQRVFLAGYKLAFVPESYVLHNHRTTFKSIYTDEQIKHIIKARILQCKVRNSFNIKRTKKIAVYTCIVGEYDRLLSLKNVDLKNCDYFCFTDTPIKKYSSYWNIININPFKVYIQDMDCCENDSELNTKLARYVKTHPHIFFPNYEYSVWIDGNIDLVGNVNDFIKTIPDNYFMYVSQHPLRNCVYDEIEACRALNKDTNEHLDNVKKFMEDEKYPKNNGMVQSCFLVRKHNFAECKNAMEMWWDYIKTLSKRDQLSFNYVFWKLGYNYYSLPWDSLLNKMYKLLFKHSKK